MSSSEEWKCSDIDKDKWQTRGEKKTWSMGSEKGLRNSGNSKQSDSTGAPGSKDWGESKCPFIHLMIHLRNYLMTCYFASIEDKTMTLYSCHICWAKFNSVKNPEKFKKSVVNAMIK